LSVSFTVISPQTTAQLPVNIYCMSVCVWGGEDHFGKKEALIPLLIVTHCFQATLGLFSSKTSTSGVQLQRQSSWSC
jgi:hypothetical protein